MGIPPQGASPPARSSCCCRCAGRLRGDEEPVFVRTTIDEIHSDGLDLHLPSHHGRRHTAEESGRGNDSEWSRSRGGSRWRRGHAPSGRAQWDPPSPVRRSWTLASDGRSPATSCGSFFQIARLGRRGPQPRDVLRLVLSDRSPRTAGTPAPRRPAARTARAAFGRVGEGARMSRDRTRRQDPQPLRQPVQSLRYMGRFSARSIGRPLTAPMHERMFRDARSAPPGPSPPPGRG